MKFDCIILNPPYHRSMHLKILAEAIKHLKDEKSVCVNLSPVRWLQDPLAKYKKNSDLKRFEESVAKHIESLELLVPSKMTEIFSAAFNAALGVYVARKPAEASVYESIPLRGGVSKSFVNSIFEKIWAKTKDSIGDHSCEFKKRTEKTYVFLQFWGGHIHRGEEQVETSCVRDYGVFEDDLSGGKTIQQLRDENPHVTNGVVDTWPVACFTSAAEARSFFNFAKLTLMQFLCYTCGLQLQFLPFLGDAINPRTGLNGYKGEWTDEDLVQFFGLTDDEKKVIEETMRKYK